MSIVSFKHIDTETLFAQTKFSAAANNASYYQGDNTELLYFGTPDVMYDDVCFCKEKGVIYTHGRFYISGNNNDVGKTYSLSSKNSLVHAKTSTSEFSSKSELMQSESIVEQIYTYCKDFLLINSGNSDSPLLIISCPEMINPM